MGLFGFSGSRKRLPWKQVQTVEELVKAVSNTEKPQLFFKHSTRCAVSAMALNAFESNWNNEDADINFIDLLAYRDVSLKLAEITGVKHESPQVIVIKDQEVIYAESHSNINVDRIETRLKR